jgi:tryptophan synthase alpha chain
LAAGTTLDSLFDLVQKLRTKIETPIVFLTYLNPVFRYGYTRFCEHAAAVGVDGLIIPDMPYEEQGELVLYTDKYGLSLISLVSPTSSLKRVTRIAGAATGFLYLVSSMGVTGVRDTIDIDISAIVEAARRGTQIPVAVGFGIHTAAQAAATAKEADGVIVGSAVVRIIAQYGEHAAPALYTYAKEMKDAIRSAAV